MEHQSATIGELAKALVAFQAEAQPVGKDRASNRNKYATLDAIQEYLRTILPKHGLAYTQGPISWVDNGQAYVGVRTTVMHISGEWTASEILVPLIPAVNSSGKESTPLMQVAGINITYLKRYSLTAALGLNADEDTDGASQQTEALRSGRQPAVQVMALPEPWAALTDKITALPWADKFLPAVQGKDFKVEDVTEKLALFGSIVNHAKKLYGDAYTPRLHDAFTKKGMQAHPVELSEEVLAAANDAYHNAVKEARAKANGK